MWRENDVHWPPTWLKYAAHASSLTGWSFPGRVRALWHRQGVEITAASDNLIDDVIMEEHNPKTNEHLAFSSFVFVVAP